jgi:arylsulfatase A-like enzyme
MSLPLSRRALLAAAAAPAVLRGQRKAGDKPNLLFLWTDQQRADSMAAYGNLRYRVPAMNRLASQSVVFDRAYVTQPVCTPSRSSIMTGLWPHHSGCTTNNVALKPDFLTFPELLADSAYRTGYMGKWHLGDEIFAQRGFEQWAAIEDGIYQSFYSPGRDQSARSAYHHFLLRLGYKPDDARAGAFSRRFATRLPVEHSKPSFLAQEASRFILENRKEPWLLYVNTLEPHTPFASALDELHTPEEAPLMPNFPGALPSDEPEWYIARRKKFASPRSEGFDLTSPAGWQRMHRSYAGLCALVDQAWGRILWALEASGQANNTIVVCTSDHGEMMGSHSLITKQVMYEESVRVPYLLRVPFRRQKPHRVQSPVSHIDTVPTLLQLMGKKDPGLDGQSLVPLIEGQAPPRDVFIEWTRDSGGGPDARTVITADHQKLVLHDTDKSMLFDRVTDPLEMNNLYYHPGRRATRKVLTARIAAWQKHTHDRMPLPT